MSVPFTDAPLERAPAESPAGTGPDFAVTLFASPAEAAAAHRAASETALSNEAHVLAYAHARATLLFTGERGRGEVERLVFSRARQLAVALRDSKESLPAATLAMMLDPKRSLQLKATKPPAGSVTPDLQALAALLAVPRADAGPRETYLLGKAFLRFGMLHAALILLTEVLHEEKLLGPAATLIAQALVKARPVEIRDRLARSLFSRHPTLTILEPLLDPADISGASSLETEPALWFERARGARARGKNDEERNHLARTLELSLARINLAGGLPHFVEELAARLVELEEHEQAARALMLALALAGRSSAQAVDWVNTLAGIGQRRIAPTALPAPRLPLVLCAQVQRSGGSLLAQLFDGHPDVIAMPHELRMREPKWEWPDIDPTIQPASLFLELLNERYPYFVLAGYTKADGNTAAGDEHHRFALDFPAFAASFIAGLKQHPPSSQRDVLDRHFLAFDGAWNEQTSGTKRLVTAFTPRTNMSARSMELFFRDYPDGHLVTIVRDPLGWFASARRHGAEYQSPETAIGLWKMSSLSSLQLAIERPEQVSLVLYEDLVRSTEPVMRWICERVGLAWHPTLVEPTFAGEFVLPNSSYVINQRGVQRGSLARWKTELDPKTLAYIQSEASPIYDMLSRRYRIG